MELLLIIALVPTDFAIYRTYIFFCFTFYMFYVYYLVAIAGQEEASWPGCRQDLVQCRPLSCIQLVLKSTRTSNPCAARNAYIKIKLTLLLLGSYNKVHVNPSAARTEYTAPDNKMALKFIGNKFMMDAQLSK